MQKECAKRIESALKRARFLLPSAKESDAHAKLVWMQSRFRGAYVRRRWVQLRTEFKFRPLRRAVVRMERGDQEYVWL